MNPVEIEEAVSDLAREPFDRVEFPFQFLTAFDNPATTIKRLRSGSTNQSDIPGGVLQRSNIHIATCDSGAVDVTLSALRESPKTAAAKAKFILATDGESFQAEDLNGGGTVACSYAEFPDHFGFFLPLAGITTVKEIRESSFDVKATGRLNRLYIQLLKENPDWATAERQHDMNHFMARLIFCFFAEDTDIFQSEGLFTREVEQLTAGDADSTHKVIGEIFRAMDTDYPERDAANLPTYARKFPHVNGQLFSGSTDVPRFSKVARSYLMHIGSLNWKKINPDIFGSMIQAVADEDERGSLGMHYTSVPNILKVLNPLFLDDLRDKLAEAGESPQKLLNLRKRMARIRVFDPACGSGNFLVIAYKAMREIEAEINKRREESDRRSDISIKNFRGIELRDFPAEVARLALIIAEYQADVTYRGQKEAIAEFLPLGSENWIIRGNALRLDWLNLCPPSGTGVRFTADDLLETPLDQSEIDFESEGGETYLCGNPPYKGGTEQNAAQKSDMELVCSHRTDSWKSLDYVSGWFLKFVDYARHCDSVCAFVTTNSIVQGEQVARLWPIIFDSGLKISFAHTSFKWSNLASNKAAVSVAIIGLEKCVRNALLYDNSEDGSPIVREVENISPYLIPHESIVVEARSSPLSTLSPMTNGNKPADGGSLIFGHSDAAAIRMQSASAGNFVRRFVGAEDSIQGKQRFCLWIDPGGLESAMSFPLIAKRIEQVREMRRASSKELTRRGATSPHRFQQVRQTGSELAIVIPRHSSESRPFLPVSMVDRGSIIADGAFAIFDAPLWNLSILVSSLHLVWIAAVCGKIKTDYRYSSTLGWNTFPAPMLTSRSKAELSICAENILLAREAHFPATIADLYDPEKMPDDLRRAHEANDEVLERIYVGRRFRNDTERLEKLFELYTRMTSKRVAP
ncbi:MAG: lactate dehydrogenase [Proteobacteria bacterium]|nr:lactate dehydrogenase [Pseudomonadota bacterium]MDA1320662.1 lactate dehydrogenase [Pseudomonadota bacterium]